MNNQPKHRLPTKRGEIWVEFYPGYLISNYGRWWSLYYRKIIKQFPNSSGYFRACLKIDGKRKHIFTHIKVVEIFGDKNGNRMPGDTLFGYGMSIDHVDANKKHNQYTNLELVTHRTNCLRREENIRLHSVGGG